MGSFLSLAVERDKAIKKPARKTYWINKFKSIVKEKRLLLAVEETKPIGFLYLRFEFIDYPATYIELVFVSSAFRKQGIAGRLFAKAELVAGRKGHEKIFSSADFDNHVSIKMHKQFCYNRCGYVDNIKELGSREVFFVKVLK